ncbi:MAG: class I SAM-dependent methyltransferase [Paraglaciecola sp.]|uniref:class I SAM-dependent methyltransferase n=1 Tax=Paraglaciecola sp. TaxID=1920173 RepID=UPI00273E01D4|nr:class I SAM-dependent methyltransferase [Paraglaciecola sp.]MDP5030997.1 class I SAM-dependent methyltransferase [Paraglaciecola sp.]MDP5132746.1 class I SAM-dependent methyltransferase [Paraglaciecola sp.]
MNNVKILIQASSRSWAGGRDICMGLVNDEIAVVKTIRQAFGAFPSAQFCLIAPEFDRNGELSKVIEKVADCRLKAFYGFDESPLKRMIAASLDLADEDYVIRVDGIHFCFDTNLTRQMLEIAQHKRLDCIKLPADFPVHFSSEVFRVGALRELEKILNIPELAKFHVHPKTYFELNRYDYRFEHLSTLPEYSDEYLKECRLLAKELYNIPRLEVSNKRTDWADTLSYHYHLALNYLKSNMKVLDIACGNGYGVRMMSEVLTEVHGADIDFEIIAYAENKSEQTNVSYFVQDVNNMDFDDASYDAVTSFETLEHVPAESYLKELRRVIKPGGMLIISTPQNSFGHIPVNACHLVEYSLESLLKLVGQYFLIIKVIGIKAGTIHSDSDPYGTNTFLVCINPL